MKTIGRVIGAALIISFGIFGMYRAALPAIVLDPNESKALESNSWDTSEPELPVVNAVMSMEKPQLKAHGVGNEPIVSPVSLECVTR
jgi:hypothetical protein